MASGPKAKSTYTRIWFQEHIAPDKVAFEPGVFLVTSARAKNLIAGFEPKPVPEPSAEPGPEPEPATYPGTEARPGSSLEPETKTIRLTGQVSPEVWNRLGTKVLPKLRFGKGLQIGIDSLVSVDSNMEAPLKSDLKLILEDLGLADKIRTGQIAEYELNAAIFLLYGINREEVDYIMETFPIVKRKDMQKYGDFRTKLTILKIYNEMKTAMEIGKPYQTMLDPPPTDPMVAHTQ